MPSEVFAKVVPGGEETVSPRFRFGIDCNYWIRPRVWLDEAVLLRACVDGVREADPEARFVLHIAHWFNPAFATAFFRTMIDAGVTVDVLGASYYPSSGIPEEHFGLANTIEELGRYVDEVTRSVGRPLLFAEFAYPSAPPRGGLYRRWGHQVTGYPLTPEGQRDWLGVFLDWCENNPRLLGAIYWSPEYYTSKEWAPFSIFHPDGTPKPALAALATRASRGFCAKPATLDHRKEPVIRNWKTGPENSQSIS